MIFVDSRYADGVSYYANDSRTGNNRITVRRKFPAYSTSFYTYVWVAGDRIDQVAYTFMGDSANWWVIMDANPEIINPFAILPGTHIRIPRA